MNLRDSTLKSLAGEHCFPPPFDVWEGAVYPQLESSLCRHFGLPNEDHEGVLHSLGAAIRWGGPAYIGPSLPEVPLGLPPVFPHKKITRNIWGTLRGIETYSDVIGRPFARVKSVAEIDAHPWPDPGWYDYSRLGWFTNTPDDYLPVDRWAHKHAQVARLVGGWNPLFSRITDLFGMEQALLYLALHPDLIEAAVEHIAGFVTSYYDRLGAATSGFADIMAFGDDFASQTTLLMDPALWRKLFLPHWRRLFEIAHRHGMKSMMHMCGGVRPVLRDLVDAGLDIYQGVQTSASGIDPEDLKKEFGNNLAYYGGIDIQQLLPRGTPDQVRRETRRMIDILGRRGGYIVASAHFLMDDVPFHNVLAMIEAVNASQD